MNILVIGCGRVGSRLATILCGMGHDVSVVDADKHSFELLGDDFTGLTFEGVPIDDDVLTGAGVRSCEAAYAVTGDDNLNIMASQLCEKIFCVPKVYTRITEPKKEEIYNSMGLKTICPTNYTVDSFVSLLDENAEDQRLRFGNHSVRFFTLDAPPEIFGKTALNIDLEPGEILYAIIHPDCTMKLVSTYNIMINEGDKLIFSKLVD